MLGIHTVVHIVGEDDCEVFAAMCRLVGVTPADLASRIVNAAIVAHRTDRQVIDSMRIERYMVNR